MAAPLLFANNASTTLAGPITNTSTSVNVAAGSGVLFPNPGNGQFFKLTFLDQATKSVREIVHVTAVSGDTFTIVRAQEGTTALSWLAGDFAINQITAGTLSYIVGQLATLSNGFFQGTDKGSANTMSVPATTPTAPALAAGQLYLITKSGTGNTGPLTLSVAGGPQTSVVYGDGGLLAAGDYPASATAWLVYTGGVFQFLGLARSVGGDGALVHFGTAGGTATNGAVTAFTTTLAPVPAAITAPFVIFLHVLNTNGANPTLDFGSGPKPIINDFTGTALTGGEMIGYAILTWDGGELQLMNPGPQFVVNYIAGLGGNALPNIVNVQGLVNVYTKAVVGGVYGLMEGAGSITCNGAAYIDFTLPIAFSTDEKWTILYQDTNNDGAPGTGIRITGHPVSGGVVRLFPTNAGGSIFTGTLSFKYHCMGHQ